MDSYKLKIKMGPYEFEAEGPQEAVERQFAEFKELVSSAPVPGRSGSQIGGSTGPQRTLISGVVERLVAGDSPVDEAIDVGRFSKLFRRDKESLSLSALPNTENREADAVMLLLLGYKHFLSRDSVTAVALNASLRQSGIAVDRLDRPLSGFIGGNEGLLMRTGVRRGVQYRLTNLGMARAEKVADELLKIIP